MTSPRPQLAAHRRTPQGCHVYTRIRWNALLQRWEERIVLTTEPLALAERRRLACA